MMMMAMMMKKSSYLVLVEQVAQHHRIKSAKGVVDVHWRRTPHYTITHNAPRVSASRGKKREEARKDGK
jgi:hypothetical protein